MGPMERPLGPLGAPWAHWGPLGPKSALAGGVHFQNFTKIDILAFVGSKNVKKIVEIEGGGTPLARFAAKFCPWVRSPGPKWCHGDPFGDKKV